MQAQTRRVYNFGPFHLDVGTPLWSDEFDESAKDLLELEDSISQRVVKALRLNLAKGEHEALIRHQTGDTNAYESYMKGRYFWNQRSRDGLIKATDYFERAISEDPNYALAYADSPIVTLCGLMPGVLRETKATQKQRQRQSRLW